jgi:hypothetical protein
VNLSHAILELLRAIWRLAAMPATIGGQWTIILMGVAGICEALRRIGIFVKAGVKFFERMDQRLDRIDRLFERYSVEEIIRRLEKLENGKERRE